MRTSIGKTVSVLLFAALMLSTSVLVVSQNSNDSDGSPLYPEIDNLVPGGSSNGITDSDEYDACCNGTYYVNVDDAMASITKGTVSIDILRDCVMHKIVEIGDDTSLTVETNGHTLTSECIMFKAGGTNTEISLFGNFVAPTIVWNPYYAGYGSNPLYIKTWGNFESSYISFDLCNSGTVVFFDTTITARDSAVYCRERGVEYLVMYDSTLTSTGARNIPALNVVSRGNTQIISSDIECEYGASVYVKSGDFMAFDSVFRGHGAQAGIDDEGWSSWVLDVVVFSNERADLMSSSVMNINLERNKFVSSDCECIFPIMVYLDNNGVTAFHFESDDLQTGMFNIRCKCSNDVTVSLNEFIFWHQ